MRPMMKGSLWMIGLSIVMVLCSDIFIRARGLDGYNGLNARSYDIVATVMLTVGLWAFWMDVRKQRRLDDPMTTHVVYLVSRCADHDMSELVSTLRIMVAATMGAVQATVVEEDGNAAAYLVGRESLVQDLMDRFKYRLEADHTIMMVDPQVQPGEKES